MLRTVIEQEEPGRRWWWPWGRGRRQMVFRGPFKITVWQRSDANPSAFHISPLIVEGYVHADGAVTTTVGYEGAARLKRTTGRSG